MHNARQQALLTALGIRQWVPRAATAVPVSSVQLWRQLTDEPDQATVDHAHAAVHQLNQDYLNHHLPPEPASVSAELTEQLASSAQDADIPSEQEIERRQPEPASGQEENETQDINGFGLEAVGTSIVHSFRLQACEINQWIVLVNEADLQNPQHNTLWKNILLAFRQPEVSHFSWPLSEGQRWQRMTGSQAALNGFLFRMGLDKRVGLMSELADPLIPDRIERLPHLAELIEQPLKKRLLWQLLKQP